MYIPSSFNIDDIEEVFDFIQHNSFGIVFSQCEGKPFATHIPLILDRSNNCLYGHMAKSNPQWKEFDNEILVVFPGPHTYISPTWYESTNVVPTWNYIAVHIYGKVSVIQDSDELISILKDSTDFYESKLPSPWDLTKETPDFIKSKLGGIVGLKINITKMEGKAKLSQNHSHERKEKLVEHLKNSNEYDSKEIAKLMEGRLK